jgi:hypothetical protein
VMPSDVLDDRTIGDLRVSANQIIQQLLEVISFEVDFHDVYQSKLAAAVIACTRKLLQIKNYWNDDLKTFTRYDIVDLRPLILVLMEKRVSFLYDENTSEGADVVMKDSGYLSPQSASETDDDDKPNVKRRRLTHRAPIIFGVV